MEIVRQDSQEGQKLYFSNISQVVVVCQNFNENDVKNHCLLAEHFCCFLLLVYKTKCKTRITFQDKCKFIIYLVAH